MKRSLSRSRLSRLSSFTLVELLVVMGIIAILAGVLFNGITSALKAAKKAKAANTAANIQTAAMAYYAEYSVYPAPTTETASKDFVIADNDAANWHSMIYGLSGNINPYNATTNAPAGPVSNTRSIAFLSLRSSDVDANNAPLNPLPPDTTHLYFNIAVDYDYDGILGTGASAIVMPNFNGTFNATTGGTSTAGVAVWANCTGKASNATPGVPGQWVHIY